MAVIKHGIKMLFGCGPDVSLPLLPSGWKCITSPDNWMVLRDREGKEYFYGEGLCYPRCVATVFDSIRTAWKKHGLKPGQVYCDAENTFNLEELRKEELRNEDVCDNTVPERTAGESKQDDSGSSSDTEQDG